MKTGRPPKPIHVFSEVRSLSRHKDSAEKAVIDYWNGKSNRRTEILWKDIIRIECDCEEMLITLKSDRIRTFNKRKSRATTNLVSTTNAE